LGSGASKYDLFERRWNYYTRIATRLLQPLEIRIDYRILELASGTGSCTKIIASRCIDGEVICIEKSKEMIKIAKKNMKSAGFQNVSFIHGDVANLRHLAKDLEKFDLVICNSAFWQFPKHEEVFREGRRALRHGGYFAFNIPLWYSSKKEENIFRVMINSVLFKHDIDPAKF
jgi:ubiquinone/menaquinone biosynthesis C-methylase UbiE